MMSEKELPADECNVYRRALAALELRNYGLVVSLLAPLVAKRPEFLEGRSRLRQAQIARTKGKSSFLGGGLSLGRSKVGRLVESGDFAAALAEAEKALDADPAGAQANKDLFAAAEATAESGRRVIVEIHKKLGGNERVDSTFWKKLAYIQERSSADIDGEIAKEVQAAQKKAKTYEAIARFALQTIVEADPKNVKARHELGDYLMRIEEYDDAVLFFEKLGPKDLEARGKAKQAAALRSMRGKGKTFQEDVEKSRAEKLQAGEKVVGAEESADEIYKRFEKAFSEGNPAPEEARKLAAIFLDSEEFDKAIWYFRYLSDLANNTDSNLLRKISDAEMRKLSAEILNAEKRLASLSQDSDEALALRTEIEQLKRQRAEQMLGEARKRVDRNPTDLQYRFELGEQLVLAGYYKEAIPELQKARSNPNTRTRALSRLGECYAERNMLDLAAKTLTDAASEIPGMDGTKKDILYNLGLVYERMGNADKSLDCMKEIYEVDYEYRDVAKRVEDSYATPPSDPEDGSPGSPFIASFNPTSGEVGSTVVITGGSFGATPAVRFNGIAASSTVNPAGTEITATVPSGATTGPITAEVAGQPTATSPGNFTVMDPLAGAGVPANLTPTTPPLEGSAAKKLPPDEEENA